jgi:P-type E1-E2 ATPase
MLISGDRDAEVRYLAGLVGISEVYSAKSPEEKVAIVRSEAAGEKTLFVGDGINDAPAMQAATVGVAFGVSSDIAAEAADAVVLEASLAKVDELVHIGRRMRGIALQSALCGNFPVHQSLVFDNGSHPKSSAPADRVLYTNNPLHYIRRRGTLESGTH